MAADKEKRQLVIVTPGRIVRTSDSLPPRESLPPEVVAEAEAIAPSTEPWQVVAVGMTDLPAFEADPYQAVPFLGSLEVLVQIGHGVILFEGHPSAFIQFCRGADLLIVDGEMIPFLPADWLQVASTVMRRPNVIKINRRGKEVLKVEKVSWQA
jgi:hypothetical protein